MPGAGQYCRRAFSCPAEVALVAVRKWGGILCETCQPRAEWGDGRICRSCAARLGDVEPDTVSAWVSRRKVTDVRYEGRSPWFMPAEIITVADALHKREKAREARKRERLLALADEAVA